MTLAIIAIVVTAALATMAFAIPQQVMKGGHRHHHHNNNHNNTTVDQQVNQQNQCSSPERRPWLEIIPQSNTVCVNEGTTTQQSTTEHKEIV